MAYPIKNRCIIDLFNQQSSDDNRKQRNRRALLNKVNNFWIKGVLEKSLHYELLIELDLEKRLDAIDNSFDMGWITPERVRQDLPRGTKILDFFEQLGEGGTLLILGNPGAGKTLTLLRLASDLIYCAEQETDQPIPVVLNLSSWRDSGQIITDWIVQELRDKYQVPEKLGKNWVNEQQLLLLLDGLDEVNVQLQEACVIAINQFIQHYGGIRVVVCSRIENYEGLSIALKFQSCIYLKPLTAEQLDYYFERGGEKLVGISRAVQHNSILQELVKTPLMFSVLTLTYQGFASQDIPIFDSKQDFLYNLFNDYIEQMFFRRQAIKKRYPEKDSKHWLTFLAKKMNQESQSIFLIENMQPFWIPNVSQKRVYSRLIPKLRASLIGLIIGKTIAQPVSKLLSETGLIASSVSLMNIRLVIIITSFIIGWIIGEAYEKRNHLRMLIHTQIRIAVENGLEKAYLENFHERKPEYTPELSLEGLPEHIPEWSWERFKWILIIVIVTLFFLTLVFGSIFGIILTLMGSSFSVIFTGFFAFGGVIGAIFGIPVGFSCWLDKSIKTIETVKFQWSCSRLKRTVIEYSISYMKIGGAVGLILGWISGLFPVISTGLFGFLTGSILKILTGFLIGLMLGLLAGLGKGIFNGFIYELLVPGRNVKVKTIPNQGIWNSALNAGFGFLYGSLIVGFLCFPIMLILTSYQLRLSIIFAIIFIPTGSVPVLDLPSLSSIIFASIMSLFIGSIPGTILALSLGGKAYIQHFSLRIILYSKGLIPWNYTYFLDYATERILLRKVGNGYIFVHRLLLEHFAMMEPDK